MNLTIKTSFMMTQLGAKHHSFNGMNMVRRIPGVNFDFMIIRSRKTGNPQNGVVWMGNINEGKAGKRVSLLSDRSLRRRVGAGGDFVITDEDLTVESEDECGVNPLVIENGWRVRRLVQKEEEMRKVAYVQAEAFYSPMMFFNGFFFEIFKAEVLSGLYYKIRNSAPNRYASLVAETEGKPDSQDNLRTSLVGVVDITALREYSILRFLDGADEYLYVSGIAVLAEFRRRKVATVLLKACDLIAMLWKFDYLVLHAYEDDTGARKLYSNAGYRVVAKDPPWMSSWIGRKPRVMMVKKRSQAHESNSQ